MKKWYLKLKESKNYRTSILVVLVLLILKLVTDICAISIGVYRLVSWSMFDSDGFIMVGTDVASLVFTVLAFTFVCKAVKFDPKMIIGVFAALAVVAVIGISLSAVLCIVICGYWLWAVKRSADKPVKGVQKCLVAIIAIVIVVGYFGAGLLSMGYWSEWGPASIEEGDWSEWTTLDENGNIVKIDEDGNSSTYQSFEFE